MRGRLSGRHFFEWPFRHHPNVISIGKAENRLTECVKILLGQDRKKEEKEKFSFSTFWRRKKLAKLKPISFPFAKLPNEPTDVVKLS